MNLNLFVIPLLLSCGSNKREGISDIAKDKPQSDYTYVDTLKKTNDHQIRLLFHNSLNDRYSAIINSFDNSFFDDPSIYKEKFYEGKKFFYSKEDSALLEVDVAYPKITINRDFYLQDSKKYRFKLLIQPFQMGFLKDQQLYVIDQDIKNKGNFRKSDLRITNNVASEEGIRYEEVGHDEYLKLKSRNEPLMIVHGNDVMKARIGNKLTFFFNEYANRYFNGRDDLDNLQIRFDVVFELDGKLSLSDISLLDYNDGKYKIISLRKDFEVHLVDFLTKQTTWPNKEGKRTFQSINYNVGLKI